MKTLTTKKSIKFDLINNARSSLNHAVVHLTNPDGVRDDDLKFAIRDVAHVVELLLKERLRCIHPAFIWQSVDKYPLEAHTVDTNTAVKRLIKIGSISLDEEDQQTISACRKFRNKVEHYEFELNTKETEVVIGRMLSFIFNFSDKHLGIDLEEEFRSDDTWKTLIEMYEFWEAHHIRVEKQLEGEGKCIIECPSCGAMTFDLEAEKCALCDHAETVTKCDICNTEVPDSEIEAHGDADMGVEVLICKNCIEAQAEAYYEGEY